MGPWNALKISCLFPKKPAYFKCNSGKIFPRHCDAVIESGPPHTTMRRGQLLTDELA